MPKFQPGQSGNPRGRPRGARNFASEFMAAVQADAETPAGDTRLSKLQTAIRALIDKAAKGDARAIEAVLDRVAKLEARVSGETARPRAPFTGADREVIAAIHQRLVPEEPR